MVLEENMDIAQRTSRAVESLIENEALITNLDDRTANLLLQWGIDCAEHIVQDTEAMTDDEAEAAMYGRMRALRRMLRQIDRWMPGRRGMGVDANVLFLSKMVDLAAIVYGQEVQPVQGAQNEAFLRASLGNDPDQAVQILRQLIENLYQGGNV
jgi:hypothetical protein